MADRFTKHAAVRCALLFIIGDAPTSVKVAADEPAGANGKGDFDWRVI